MTEEIKKEETSEAEAAVESEIDAETESVMEELEGDSKGSKKELKQLRDENKKLTAKLAEAESALEKAKSDAAEAADKYMRVYAEYENFRKRSRAEHDATFTEAYADALKEVMPIIDNLERAAQFKDTEKLADGIELIFKSASDMLVKLGVEQFGAAGETFDPNLHNAVMHIEDESYGENEIVDVFQKGYKKGDRIIRFAMVRVAN